MYTNYDSYQYRKAIIDAWGQFVKDMIEEQGWEGYLLTFKFHQIRGSQRHRLAVMQQEITRVYSTLLTRMYRRPNAPVNRGRLPIWIAGPDLPVNKHERQLISDIRPNDGLHEHALALFKPYTRLKTSVKEHFDEHLHKYIRSGDPLLYLHAEPITHRPDYVARYAMKTLTGRRGFALDDLLVLPRIKKEVRY